jgi:hypothetical protein
MVTTWERRYSNILNLLTIVPKDNEMTKFYNDIKAAESLHATAATIIQGIKLRLFTSKQV